MFAAREATSRIRAVLSAGDGKLVVLVACNIAQDGVNDDLDK